MIKKALIFLLLTSPCYAATGTVNSRPNGDVTTDWTVSGCVSHFDCIDEETADDDTTYLVTGVDAEAERYDLPNASIPSTATITSVITKIRGRRVTACTAGLDCPAVRHRMFHDTTYNGAYQEYTSASYVNKTRDFTASEAWQPSDFDGQVTDIGFQIDTIGDVARITQFYLEIIYKERRVFQSKNVDVYYKLVSKPDLSGWDKYEVDKEGNRK